MTVRILQGHVLDRLAGLPDESAHCVVTSPPYYGLRDYGIEPQVWGDACKTVDYRGVHREHPAHVWGDQGKNAQRLRNGIGGSLEGATVADGMGETLHPSAGSRCLNGCGAWLGSLGLEPTPALYIEHMVAVFREVRRVMRKDASCWINIGDSYAGASGNNGWRSGDPDNPRNSKQHNRNGLGFVAGIKPKDLLGIPWALAFALREDGWYLRSEIIWAKKAPMPEGVTDRPTSATEKVFLLTKSPRYFYDAEAVKEEASGRAPGNIERAYEHMGGTKAGLANIGPATSRNMRSWWLLGPEPFPEAHFGTYPTEIPRRCIKAGTSERGVCPKCGAPWIRMVDRQLVATRGNVGEDVKHREPMNNDRGQKWGDTNSVYGHYDSQTIGWHPGCLCVGENPNLPAVPATILDPFLGAGTTALVADQLGRNCIGIELNPSYAEMSERRIRADAGMFAEIAVELRPRK